MLGQGTSLSPGSGKGWSVSRMLRGSDTNRPQRSISSSGRPYAILNVTSLLSVVAFSASSCAQDTQQQCHQFLPFAPALQIMHANPCCPEHVQSALLN